MRRFTSPGSVLPLLLLLGSCSARGTSGAGSSADWNDDTAPIRDRYAASRLELLQLINADREEVGVPPVVLDSLATIVAQLHAEAMANNNFFSHYGLEGDLPYERLAEAGGRSHVRENIFRWEQRVANPFVATDPWQDFEIAQAQQWFMSSPGHREAIIDPARTGVGLGVAVNRQEGTVYVVQEFVALHAWIDVASTGWRAAATDIRGHMNGSPLRPLLLVIYQEPEEKWWQAESEAPPRGSYPDGLGQGSVIPPWLIEWYPGDRSFGVSLSLPEADGSTRYYGVVYVAPDNVVNDAISRRNANTSNGWPGAAFVIDIL